MKKLIFLLLLLPAIVQAQTGIIQGREFRYNPKTAVAYAPYTGDSSVVMINRATGKFFRTHITGGGGGGGYNPGDSIAYLYSIVYPKENLGTGIPQTYPRGDTVELQRTMDNGSGIEADTLPTGEQIFHLNGSLTKDATLNGANTYKFKLENTHFWQTGTHGSGPTIPEYFESQFFFNNRKSAFRAGRANGSQFSEASVGNFSTAFGANTEAKGDYTVAGGLNTRAMGAGSVSLGVDGAAYGNTAITIGNNNNSHHDYSITIGRNSSARGVSGLAAGFALKQKGFGGTVFGIWNDSTDATSNTDYNAANRIFQVGNGQSDSLRSNAMTILSDGRTGFGTTTPHSSALVQLSSTTRGFLFPRMTATEMNAISSPDTSLVVYNTTAGLFFYYTGAAWDTIGSSSGGGGGISDGDKGDITVTDGGLTWTINNSAVTKAKFENIAVGKALANNTTSAASPAEVGVWMLLTTGTASAAATIDVNLTNYYTVYDEIKITFWDIRPATDNVSLYMRVSTDGSTYDAGASAYKYQITYSAGATAGGLTSTGATHILLANNVDNTSTNMNQLEVVLRKPGQSTLKPSFPIRFDYVGDSGTVYVQTNTIGLRDAAQDTQAVRFLASSGNINGSYSVTGIKY